MAQFIAVCHDRGLKPATISTWISALSYIHRLHRLKNPSKAFIIKKLLYSIRKTKVSDKRHGFTIPLLRSLIQSLSKITANPFTKLLLKTMYLVAFYALLRLGEISDTKTGKANIVKLENVSFSYDKSRLNSASIHLTHFKHSKGQTAKIVLNRSKHRQLCPVRTLAKYVSQISSCNGPLFRFSSGHPVTASFFRRMLKRCLVESGLDTTKYTSHSFRIGGATLAHDLNFSNTQIQQLGRWSSQAYTKYLRPSLSKGPIK